MTTYRTYAGRPPARLTAGDLLHLARPVRRTHEPHDTAPKPPNRRSRASDRTRSKRWRSGTRRTRRQVEVARRRGLPHPLSGKGFVRVYGGCGLLIIDETLHLLPR